MRITGRDKEGQDQLGNFTDPESKYRRWSRRHGFEFARQSQPRKIPFPGPRDGEAEAEAERLPMTTRRIRGARKGAGWISGVRLEPEPAPAVRVDRIKDMIVTAPEHRVG